MRPAELLVIEVTWAQRGLVQFSGAERSGAAWFPAEAGIGEGVAAIKVKACDPSHGTRRAWALGNTAKEMQGQLLPGSNMAAEGVCLCRGCWLASCGLHKPCRVSTRQPGLQVLGVLVICSVPSSCPTGLS